MMTSPLSRWRKHEISLSSETQYCWCEDGWMSSISPRELYTQSYYMWSIIHDTVGFFPIRPSAYKTWIETHISLTDLQKHVTCCWLVQLKRSLFALKSIQWWWQATTSFVFTLSFQRGLLFFSFLKASITPRAIVSHYISVHYGWSCLRASDSKYCARWKRNCQKRPWCRVVTTSAPMVDERNRLRVEIAIQTRSINRSSHLKVNG